MQSAPINITPRKKAPTWRWGPVARPVTPCLLVVPLGCCGGGPRRNAACARGGGRQGGPTTRSAARGNGYWRAERRGGPIQGPRWAGGGGKAACKDYAGPRLDAWRGPPQSWSATTLIPQFHSSPAPPTTTPTMALNKGPREIEHVSRDPTTQELSCQVPRSMDNPMRACTGSV